MSAIASYRDLIAWQKAMDLAELVYRLTENYPARERYGLAAQMRDASVSIASNIAEGHRQGTRVCIRHLVIALGSHGELDSQELSFRLGYIAGDSRIKLAVLTVEVGRLTNGLLRSLRPREAS